eukprot:s2857_g3.t1
MAIDRLNRSRRDKLDWAAKLGLGPLAGGEVPIPPGAEVPRNVRDAMAQKKQAEEMAELRRRIEKQTDVVGTAPPKTEEEDVDASGFLNPNAKANAKKKVAPKSVLELRIGTKPTVVVTSRPDEPDRIEEEPVKDRKAERRAKQKAATRFQDVDVEEEYSYDSHDRRRKKRRGRVAYNDEDSDRRRHMRSRSGRYSEDQYGRRDRSRSMDGCWAVYVLPMKRVILATLKGARRALTGQPPRAGYLREPGAEDEDRHRSARGAGGSRGRHAAMATGG